MTVDKQLVDTAAAALLAGVAPATIRSWAAREHLERAGRDHRGRTLYRVADVEAAALRHATETGPLDVPDSEVQHSSAGSTGVPITSPGPHEGAGLTHARDPQ